MRRGLVFGKFMPLHRGHELVIDTALAECDDLTIVVYDSDPPGTYTPMPIEKRLGWLRSLYGNVENIVAVPDLHRHDPNRDSPELAGSYAAQLGFLGEFDRVFTSEPGYEDFVRLLGARHRVVDAARGLMPISGTMIRESLYEHRAWMDPVVYSSLIRKVALVGTESTGKTTLARALAEEFRTLYVHEYGRELWIKQGLDGTFADHWRMGARQFQREEVARRQARSVVFCDTTAWTTLMWSRRSYNGAADARLEALVNETMDEYLWIVCDTDFGWVDDGVRELRGKASDEFQQQQIADLEARGCHYEIVGGSVDRRVARVADLVRQRS